MPFLPVLLPIGHERGSVRRVPIMTIGIITLCVAVMIVVQIAGIQTPSEIESTKLAFERLVNYWERHHTSEIPDVAFAVFPHLADDQQQTVQDLYESAEVRGVVTLTKDQRIKLQQLWRELQLTLPYDPRENLAYVATEPSIQSAFTHMFVHRDWWHLLGNMLFFFICATLLEDVWGRGVFLGFYLLSGLAALLPDMPILADNPLGLIGASGAISGVMGAFAVRFWNVRMRMFVVFMMLARQFWIRAWVILTFWFVVDVASIPEQLAGGTIAHLAHVSGFLFGAGFAVMFRGFGIEERVLSRRLEEKSSKPIVVNPEIDRSLDDLDRGRSTVALRRLEVAMRSDPENVDTALAYWSLCQELGRAHDGASAMTRAIRAELRAGHLHNASEHWRELVSLVPEVTMETAVFVGVVEALAARGLRQEAVETAWRALRTSQDEVDSRSFLRLASITSNLDVAVASAAAAAVLQHASSSLPERQRASELLATVRGSVALAKDHDGA